MRLPRETEISDGDLIARGDYGGALHAIAKLAHVARKPVGHERRAPRGRELESRTSGTLGVHPEKVLGEREHVIGAIAQRGDRDLDHVEPEK